MKDTGKEFIKRKLERFGLLPAAIRILNFFALSEGNQFIEALKFYLFNNILTFFPVYLIRKFYLTKILKIEIGKKSFVHMGCLFYSNVKIGNNSVIGRQSHLLGNITIGNNVSITAQSYIISSSHHRDSPTFEAYTLPVVIEDYAWIGARAMIMPGVKIGRGAVLGSASVATKHILPFSVCVGMPAKEVGKRSEEISYQLDYCPYFQ